MNCTNEIKVSVCVVTYNQEKYIRQCLQSIVDQETDFVFDVIVSDDCSTDATRDIITEFSERYPSIVKPIFHEKNMGAFANFAFVHQQATGEYIAHMDGDDYWLQGKLQAQSDFLDKTPHCNIVFHRVLIESVNGNLDYERANKETGFYQKEFDRSALILFMAIGVNSSKMYRKSVREFDVPSFNIIDYFANVEQVRDGVACFTGDEIYGVYRQHIGIASGGTKTREILTLCFEYFYEKYPEYRLQINTAALTYFFIDLKNLRKSCWMFFKTWLKTFHPLALVRFLQVVSTVYHLKTIS